MASITSVLDELSDFSQIMDEDIMQEPTLELGRLAKRLVTEDGIANKVLARQAIEEYKKFFLLCTLAGNENDVLVPSPLVDMVWQRHQLDTAPYFEDSRMFCMPGGYLHRHAVKNSNSSATSESKSSDAADLSLAEVSIVECYQRTLRRYEEIFETTPDPQIWPVDAFINTTNEGDAAGVLSAGVAIPHVEILAAQASSAADTEGITNAEAADEAKLVAELMWVGELVRAELPYKQARCPGKGEPIQQIRFYPHCECFVPSAEQEQERLAKVVREYVRFLKLVMKHNYGVEEAGEEDEVDDAVDAQVDEGKFIDQDEEVDKEKKVKPAFQVTPSKLVDELWHAHVLHSPAYFQFGAQHAPGGRYVHHEPHFDKPPNYHEPGFDQTLRAYKEEFGCPPGDIWGVLGESGGCGGGGCGGGGCGGGGCGGAGCGGGGCGGGACGGSACGVGGGTLGPRAVKSPKLACGACSATNGNGNASYESIKAKRGDIYTLETEAQSNTFALPILSLKYKHNMSFNSPKHYVLARSNLRVFCYLTVRYGMVLKRPLRMTILFARPTVSYYCFPYLRDSFVTTPLYAHIQRQIYLAEVAMSEAAFQMAQLRKQQLFEAKKVHGTTVECRKAMVREWWARHGACTELLDAMNVLLAPFNLRLAKKLETNKNSMYDHYMLLPATEPWDMPAPNLPSETIAHYTEQWESLVASMMAKKAALAKQWFKKTRQWEREARAAQKDWLQTVNAELAAQGVFAFHYARDGKATNVYWDLSFANIVDVEGLIHENAVSDRTYLRSVFANIHRNIQIPRSYLPAGAAGGEKASAGKNFTVNVESDDDDSPAPLPAPPARDSAPPPAPTPQMMSVLVPADKRAGNLMTVRTPAGHSMLVRVPAGLQPGMQFLVTVKD